MKRMAELVEKAEEIIPPNDADVDVDSDEESEQSTADIQLGFAEALERNLFLDKDWTQWDGGKIGGLPVRYLCNDVNTSSHLSTSCLWRLSLMLRFGWTTMHFLLSRTCNVPLAMRQ